MININEEIINGLNLMIDKCRNHFACGGCEIYNGQPFQVGNSTFVCDNIGKGNASKVQE